MTKTELENHNRIIRQLEKGLERAKVIQALNEGQSISEIIKWSSMSQAWVYRTAREHKERKAQEAMQQTIAQAIEDYKQQVNTIQN